MKHRMTSRFLAALLALAIFMAMAALAEDGSAADALILADEDIEIEGAELELSDDLIDLDLGGNLDSLDTDLDLDALSDGALPEAEAVQDNVSTTELVLGVKEQYTLDAEAIGSGRKVSFSSSNKKAATVTSKGVVTGVKKGSTTITCKVGGNAVAKYKVKVVPAPSKVTLSKSALTLGVKETVTLTPSVPDGTHASFTWSSKNKAVATVSKAGKITGKKAGTTTVTVRTHNGKTAKVTVTVRKAPGSVKLNKTSASLKVKGTLQLKATLPDNTYSAITWKSSNKKVAKVSAGGKVTAVAIGTATITASTFNGRTATCKVTVKPEPSEVKYRALLIGEELFTGQKDATRNRGDVLNMAEMLASVRGYYGGKFSVTKKYNLTEKQTLKAIKTTFADADADDVSLFFIATHGDVDYSGDYAGYLSMSPTGTLLLKDLAAALQAVPGKVIVILESCGAGAAVYANNGNQSNQSNQALYQEYKQVTEAFDAAVVKSFSSADIGVRVPVQSDGLQANTGEFRTENKFYVLTAARYQELSWGWETGNPEGSFNYFTLWLTQGIGISGSMPADADNNGQTTLKELYQYISDVGNDYPFKSDGKVYYQHVQAYPAKSNYVLFCR